MSHGSCGRAATCTYIVSMLMSLSGSSTTLRAAPDVMWAQMTDVNARRIWSSRMLPIGVMGRAMKTTTDEWRINGFPWMCDDMYAYHRIERQTNESTLTWARATRIEMNSTSEMIIGSATTFTSLKTFDTRWNVYWTWSYRRLTTGAMAER